ncbi:hypothetical protein [Jannaschia sp. LMIT008]|uniref:hypothetical protein n=1 Tax=Jannaschia maritima TaxID=3032585 RepID=UPI0028110C1D|nr:hypothetical protein [Jannaschia sp. LMIT008]
MMQNLGITLRDLAIAMRLTRQQLTAIRDVFRCPVRAVGTYKVDGDNKMILPLDDMLEWLRDTLPLVTNRMEATARNAAVDIDQLEPTR